MLRIALISLGILASAAARAEEPAVAVEAPAPAVTPAPPPPPEPAPAPGVRDLHFADRFFEEGDFDRATTFYKTALFAGLTDPAVAARAHFQAVRSLQRAHKFEAAAAEADRAASELAEPFAGQARLLEGQSHFLSHEPGFAAAALDRAAGALTDPDLRRKAALLQGFALAEQLRWSEAGTLFASLEGPDDLGTLATRAALHVKPFMAKGTARVDPQLAVILGLIPGVGHLYANHPQEALLALVVDLVLGVGLGWAIATTTFATLVGTFAWATLFSTFYFGGCYAAGLAAKRWNDEQERVARQGLADLLFEPLLGAPPPADWTQPH